MWEQPYSGVMGGGLTSTADLTFLWYRMCRYALAKIPVNSPFPVLNTLLWGHSFSTPLYSHSRQL